MTMPEGDIARSPRLDPRKFRDPDVTATGEPRASVSWAGFGTLWFNTGSLCNIECDGCYIESNPTNDRLEYISLAEVERYLEEIAAEGLSIPEIGFTGGEPFMNRDLPAILHACLSRGHRVLVLTNAMKPMHHRKQALLDLKDAFGDRLALRVSLDHYAAEGHEKLRGPGTWSPALEGFVWLAFNGFNVACAGRTCWPEDEVALRRGFAGLFAAHGVSLDADNPSVLVLFPEMDEQLDVAEITTACWDILNVRPETVMCATSRMILKRKDAAEPVAVPCTLLPYDPRFEMGPRLAGALDPVKLNHPHCARFCVLGGGSCSVAG
jgi:hypothetical protein